MHKDAEYWMAGIDRIVTDPKWKPYAGFDPPTGPLGAMQQSRTELAKFLDVLATYKIPSIGSRCLQLGLGPSRGTSHEVWRYIFSHVVTIDENKSLVDVMEASGYNTHDADAKALARTHAPYDMLFIDAGHSYLDAKLDYETFSPFVRPAGIIGFHDACRRHDIKAHEVWKYLEDFHKDINIITDDGIGIAWMMKS